MIYEIVCNETNERYIGSTFEPTLARRIVYHRRPNNKTTSKQIIGRGNYSYGLLEKVNVETRDELRMAERKWYDKLDCINKQRPFTTEDEDKEHKKKYNKEYNKEYIQEHKEHIKEYKKKYRQEHKEQIKEYNKEYRLAKKD
tara:strand:+ start:577 stop:1002 length:426 start_codon:yes stop_codon:yes gene_type:complete